MVRKPAVAGQFYPGSEDKLKSTIKDCFNHDLGPGRLSEKKSDLHELKGLVVPHAGYVYSGPVAAHAYSALYEDGKPDFVILIGPAHSSYSHGNASVADQDFQTPLGIIEVDSEIVEEIVKGPIAVDNQVHQREHSLEVQLPFLQYIFSDLKIVPILLSSQDLETASKVGKIINDVISGTKAVVIASTDFSHYVTREVANERDKSAIANILANDPQGLYDVVRSKNISMCGYGPVASMMYSTMYEDAMLLKYATSGDVSPMREVVGYAAIACK